VAWHIDAGVYGDVKLDGLNVAVALHAPGIMAETKWKAALYLDEKATEQQQQALAQIFSGQAGGHPAVLGEHIGDVLGVKTAPIHFQTDGRRRALRIGKLAEADIEAIGGQNEAEATVNATPLSVAPGHPTVVARSRKLEYRDHDYQWTISDRNGFYSPFTYQGP
jgi:hypothetical protein